jgi:hypothetical protein
MPPTAARLLADKSEVSGRLSGKWRLQGCIWCLSVLVAAIVLAGQTLYLWQQNPTVIHGKEKVYGSIP